MLKYSRKLPKGYFYEVENDKSIGFLHEKSVILCLIKMRIFDQILEI